MLEDRQTIIEAAHTAFRAAEDVESANTAIKPLTPKERINHVRTWEPPAFLTKGSGAAYFRIDDEGETNFEEMGALYQNLFRVISQAKQDADARKLPLRILVGEAHGDRTGLAIEAMIFRIAYHLGIQNFGIERQQENLQFADDFIFQGVSDLLREIDALRPGEMLSEAQPGYSKTSTIKRAGDARRNDYFLAALMHDIGINVIAMDPDVKSFLKKEGDVLNNQLYTREKAMCALLDGYAERGETIISQFGNNHLPGLINSANNDVVTLALNTVNTLAFSAAEATGDRMHQQANPAFLTSTMTSDEAYSLEAGANGIIHALLPGRGFDNAKNAMDMAKAVDRILAKRMMQECFPEKHRSVSSAESDTWQR